MRYKGFCPLDGATSSLYAELVSSRCHHLRAPANTTLHQFMSVHCRYDCKSLHL